MTKKAHTAWNKGLKTGPLTEEHKRKISESEKGRIISEENKIKLSIFHSGKKLSEETKKRISETKKRANLKGEKNPMFGKHHSEETKRKISETKKGKKGYWTGKKRSNKTKEKISKAHKGRKPPEKCYKRLLEVNKGRIKTKEEREKLSKSLTGRKLSPEHIAKMSGENSHRYIDGRSFEPYCPKFNASLKRKIRDRDNHICQLCGRTEEENKKLVGKILSVHHIHYDKDNCYPDLITLCTKCNTKVNSNRLYYESLFMNKLNERVLLFCFDNIN